MKKKFISRLNGLQRLGLQLMFAVFVIFYLTGCCQSWCLIAGLRRNNETCQDYCDRMQYANKSTSVAPTDDSVASVGNPVPKKKAPGQIEGPAPGEYFSTTITAGSTFNFKSSNEDYGGGYGKHKPGIGFNVGVGTVLPFNKNWAVAPAIRFTQKNASEELGYSDPGGGGGMKFTDKYSYNYLGGTMLAQYRAGKHLSFVVGPEVNFLIAGSVKNGGSSGTGEKQSLTETCRHA